jgi:hypothetical protein
MMTAFGSNTLGGTHAEFATVDGVLAWGRWIGQVNSSNLSPTQGIHYVVGLPTPAGSVTGVSYTYNMIGATSPTAGNGGVTPGTLTSASLVGNFGSSTVNVSFAGNVVSAGTPLGFTVSNISGTIGNSGGATTFSASGSFSGSLSSGGSTSVQGFFAGSGATHAGFAYQLTGLVNSIGNVEGAVALKR